MKNKRKTGLFFVWRKISEEYDIYYSTGEWGELYVYYWDDVTQQSRWKYSMSFKRSDIKNLKHWMNF